MPTVVERSRWDAVVVGAGVVGVCAGLAMQKRGLDVLLLDGDEPGSGCSFGNAGVIAASAFPLGAHYPVAALPKLLLDRDSPASLDWASIATLAPWGRTYARSTRPDAVAHGTRLLHRLLKRALPAYDALLGAELPDVHRRGWLHVYATQRECEAAERWNAIRRDHGSDARLLSATEAAALEPVLSGAIAGATWFRDAAHVVDPGAFVRGLVEVFATRGGTFRRERVRGVLHEKHASIEVVGEGRRHRTHRAVIATGARANRLLAGLGHRVPVIAEAGQHVETSLEPGAVRRPILISTAGAVLSPATIGARLVGTSRFGSPGARWRATPILDAMARGTSLVTGLQARPGASVWRGERPASADSLPIIEAVPGRPGVFLSTGHGHVGLSLGAVSGEIVADLVTGVADPVSIELGSGRFRAR